jgi:hypothetical protein
LSALVEIAATEVREFCVHPREGLENSLVIALNSILNSGINNFVGKCSRFF